MECSVCFEAPVDPVQLKCDHIFCFLCIKGVCLNQVSKLCPLCRCPIPADFLTKPKMVDPSKIAAKTFDDGQCWYYEGKNGWWLYDGRTSEDIEAYYKTGVTQCEILIAGHMYIIDFVASVQYRKDSTGKKRKIKRDVAAVAKGVGGLKFALKKSAEAGKRSKKGKRKIRSADPSCTRSGQEVTADDPSTIPAIGVKKRRSSSPNLAVDVTVCLN